MTLVLRVFVVANTPLANPFFLSFFFTFFFPALLSLLFILALFISPPGALCLSISLLLLLLLSNLLSAAARPPALGEPRQFSSHFQIRSAFSLLLEELLLSPRESI